MSTPTSNTDGLTSVSLPYTEDVSHYVLRIRPLGFPVWLDSGRPHGNFGRFDIISAAPQKTITDDTLHGTSTKQCSKTDIFAALTHELQSLEHDSKPSPTLPFTGGAIGYLGYNIGFDIEPTAGTKDRDVELPNAWFGIYHWAIVVDHQDCTTTLLIASTCSKAIQRQVLSAINQKEIATAGTFNCTSPSPQLEQHEYNKQVEKIQGYINAGDCYQVNFAQRFSSDYTGDPLALYLHTREQLPAPYSCYLELEHGAVLSFSPEQFLTANNGQVETKPIKGTAPRKADAEADAASAEELLNSKKDRAENVMIVDLLRNDLSKHCTPNSVKTLQIAALESYANVHHLVSHVVGVLDDECSHTQLLKDCFPGGSITGAPKIRAMQIINECELVERSVYCGSIGYISRNGRMDTNIAIRTLVLDSKKVYCWGGGGIVADSVADAEYQETLDKVSPLLDALTYFAELTKS